MFRLCLDDQNDEYSVIFIEFGGVMSGGLGALELDDLGL